MSERRLRRIAVVGGSLAGLRALEALRRDGFDGQLTLVGDELHAPYDRPPLSKQVLRGEWEPARLDLRRGEGLGELEVETRLGVRALALDPRERRLALSDGSEIGYDGLVIATGAAPRSLPGAGPLAGIHLLRTLDDVLALRGDLRGTPRVCVIGAGFIGLEVAASCRMLGLQVSAVDPLPVPLADRLPEAIARGVAELHRAHGVDLRCGVFAQALEGGARVGRVRLSDGSALDADVVVIGIGVRPNTAWLESSGIALADGVVCDATCATSLPDVVAAGDVARFPNALFGETMRIEHWSNAVEMANHAVRRLLAGPAFVEPFAPVPYFWSDQYDVKLQFAGRYRAGDTVTTMERSEAELRACVLLGRAGRLTGVVACNRPQLLVRYRRQIAERADFEAVVSAARG